MSKRPAPTPPEQGDLLAPSQPMAPSQPPAGARPTAADPLAEIPTTSVSDEPKPSSKPKPEPSQVERANALDLIREKSKREATIATFCECIAKADEIAERYGEKHGGGAATRIREELFTELKRRFGADDPHVAQYMRMHGLA